MPVMWKFFFFIGGARGFFLIMYKIEKKRLSIESTSFRYRPNKKKNTISNNIFNTFVRHFFRVFLTLFQNIFEKKILEFLSQLIFRKSHDILGVGGQFDFFFEEKKIEGGGRFCSPPHQGLTQENNSIVTRLEPAIPRSEVWCLIQSQL